VNAADDAADDTRRIADDLRSHVAQIERMADVRCAALRRQGVALEARPSDPALRALVASLVLLNAEIERLRDPSST
jgi:hypothetical protein